MLSSLTTYKNEFAHLHVKIEGGRRFPNKAILLISIMELVRCGYILNNQINLDDTIRVSFEYNWRKYIGTKAPTVWTPFWHLKKEPFWHFKPLHTLEAIEKLARPGESASIGKMKREIEYAYLDEELFEILKSNHGRSELIHTLKNCYIVVYM